MHPNSSRWSVCAVTQLPSHISITQLRLYSSGGREYILQVVESWVASLECFEHRPVLTALFAKYVETTADHCRRNFKTVVPLPLVNQVQTVCKVMEGFLPQARATSAALVLLLVTGMSPRHGWPLHTELSNA